MPEPFDVTRVVTELARDNAAAIKKANALWARRERLRRLIARMTEEAATVDTDHAQARRELDSAVAECTRRLADYAQRPDANQLDLLAQIVVAMTVLESSSPETTAAISTNTLVLLTMPPDTPVLFFDHSRNAWQGSKVNGPARMRWDTARGDWEISLPLTTVREDEANSLEFWLDHMIQSPVEWGRDAMVYMGAEEIKEITDGITEPQNLATYQLRDAAELEWLLRCAGLPDGFWHLPDPD